MAMSNPFRTHLREYSGWNMYGFPPGTLDPFHDIYPTAEDTDGYPPVTYGIVFRPRTRAAMESSGQSVVKNEKDKFRVMLNVGQFKPNEVEVKVVDNCVVVHGKHEERSDEHGFIQREFTRRYMLPERAQADTVKSSLSKTGVLTIEAAKKSAEPLPPNERLVPITLSNQDPVEEKK